MGETKKEDKYWIKAGRPVGHVDNDQIKIWVDKIVTGKNADGEKFTVGVKCHWFNGDGGYESGMLLTTELKPWTGN